MGTPNFRKLQTLNPSKTLIDPFKEPLKDPCKSTLNVVSTAEVTQCEEVDGSGISPNLPRGMAEGLCHYMGLNT